MSTNTVLNVIGPLPAGATFTTRNNVSYTVSAGLQVVANVADARELCASGNFEPANQAGPTSQRPTATWPGLRYFDTTIQQSITRNATDTAWLGASGYPVA